MRKNQKLGQVCVFYSGTGFSVVYQGKDSGELPFYKVGDIAANVTSGNTYLSFCNNYISRQEAAELRGTIIPQNTVVFAKIGEALKLNRRAITSGDCLIDNNAMGIAPKEDVLRVGYFFYFMKHLKMQDYAESTTVPSVRKSKLEQIGINVPYIDEQKIVEERLNLISDIILKREQELQRLDDLIKARFVEMFGSYREKRRLAEYADLITKGASPRWQGVEYNDSEEGTLFVTSENIREGYIDYSKKKYLPNKINELLPRSVLKRNDVLINIVNASIGRSAIFESDELANINQAVALVRVKPGELNVRYLLAFLNSDDALKSFDYMKVGGDKSNLSLKNISDLLIPVADINIQNDFCEFCKKVDKSKIEVQKSLDEAQLLFDSLMQQYFG